MSAGGQRSSRFAITIQEQDAVGGQVFAQSALLVDDPVQIAEMFQMLTADLWTNPYRGAICWISGASSPG